MKKKLLTFLMGFVLLTTITVEAYASVFTDSLGRKVDVPDEVHFIAPTGATTQMVLYSLCPEKLAGLAAKWDKEAEEYIASEYFNLPFIGQLYGGKGEWNPESLLLSGAELIVDIGEAKQSAAEDFDRLQSQTGIPVIHIDSGMTEMGETYRTLGKILNIPKQAEILAGYCEETYSRMLELLDGIDKKDVLYILGTKGLNVIAKDSYHSEAIDMMCNNLAVVDSPSAKGTGNEVDMEQILNWNPDVILFAPDSIYDRVADDPNWQMVSAINSGSYFKVPSNPYNWLGFPPCVQRYLGMLWIGKLLYPESADYDLEEEVTRYYDLFFHCSLTHEQYLKLTEGSFPR